METPKPQQGTWTLTAPDGRTWQAESPLRVVALESRERVPAEVALGRILKVADETPDPLYDAAQELLHRCEDSDDSCHGTLSTRFVRDVLTAAIAEATK